MNGEATVRLRDGRRYVGRAELTGGTVHMPAARLRHIDVRGERFYLPRARTWPLAAVAEIAWGQPAATPRLASVA